MTAEKRKLCRVYVVDPRGEGAVLLEKLVIVPESGDDSRAILKALVGSSITSLDKVDTYVEEIATFIRGGKETQKVVIVKDDNSDDS